MPFENLKDRKGFFNLLTLIIAVAIIVTLYYTKFSVQYHEPVIDEETQEMMSKSGIDTSSYQSTVQSTLKQIDNIEQSLQHREEELLEKMNRY